MKKSFVVIGLGRFGSSLAKTLSQMGHEVLAVDVSEERVQNISEYVTHAVQIDAMDEEALKTLGVRNFDAVVVAIGQDVQASILVTLILKELGVQRVVAKALNEMHGKVLERVGADQVVYPERDMGIRLAHNLIATNVLDYIELAPDYSIVEVACPAEFHGKTLGELNLRARYGVTVIVVKKGNEVLAAPGADVRVYDGDVLVVIGSKEGLKKLDIG
ncbi:potassium channel family protein [Calderihabitans maritimus]|uniref:K+ transport systems, NAD-binding component n=1 Tax=Calderihabitans maritimus TaxID=1246530 RepID=A0A1Z5HRY6_9FIRM|nr:TrkA family potassium uptake protein [Calderihabitans maritimus]GAW92289.1 K+ transport systems, NAD-binding component [Calderihabitans maritimus]